MVSTPGCAMMPGHGSLGAAAAAILLALTEYGLATTEIAAATTTARCRARSARSSRPSTSAGSRLWSSCATTTSWRCWSRRAGARASDGRAAATFRRSARRSRGGDPGRRERPQGCRGSSPRRARRSVHGAWFVREAVEAFIAGAVPVVGSVVSPGPMPSRPRVSPELKAKRAANTGCRSNGRLASCRCPVCGAL
jgi:hypothetical protein